VDVHLQRLSVEDGSVFGVVVPRSSTFKRWAGGNDGGSGGRASDWLGV
jgi:hypothetical protein